MASLCLELRHVVAALSLIASFSGVSQAQTVANPPSIDFVNNASTSSDSLGIRPAHKLLWSDTGAVPYVFSALGAEPRGRGRR